MRKKRENRDSQVREEWRENERLGRAKMEKGGKGKTTK